MKTTIFALLFTTCLTLPALAEIRTVDLALGTSVPKTDEANGIKEASQIEGGAISRRTGGEVVGLIFGNADKNKETKQELHSVRLMAYSKSGKGKVLVRFAETRPQTSSEILAPLSRFKKMEAGSTGKNKNGLILLEPGNFVTVNLSKPVRANRVLLIVEAMGDRDASLAIQLKFTKETYALGIGTHRLVVADYDEQQTRRNGGTTGWPGSSDSGKEEEKPSTDGHLDSGSCISRGSNGSCDMWSTSGGTKSCISHGRNGQCDMWSGSGGTTSCISHNSNGSCDMWSGSGGTTSCISHNSNGSCDMWSGSGGTVSCLSHASNGSCDHWSDGRSCLSHDMNGNCSHWSK